MSEADKSFEEVRTLVEALQLAVACSEDRDFVNNTAANHATGSFMVAAQWVLLELGMAALEDRLLQCLVDLPREYEAIYGQLACSPRGSH